jgi:hypothetical protein
VWVVSFDLGMVEEGNQQKGGQKKKSISSLLILFQARLFKQSNRLWNVKL